MVPSEPRGPSQLVCASGQEGRKLPPTSQGQTRADACSKHEPENAEHSGVLGCAGGSIAGGDHSHSNPTNLQPCIPLITHSSLHASPLQFSSLHALSLHPLSLHPSSLQPSSLNLHRCNPHAFNFIPAAFIPEPSFVQLSSLKSPTPKPQREASFVGGTPQPAPRPQACPEWEGIYRWREGIPQAGG